MPQLLIHRIWRRAWRVAVLLLFFSSLLDHAGAFGYFGDDWKRFDRKQVRVDQVIDDQTFTCGTTFVRLLGVLANEERATSFSEQNLLGKKVTLRLDAPQTRDVAGQLLAYVYLSPGDCWNVDVVRDGSGQVDRQSGCSMMPTLSTAEAERNRTIGKGERKLKSPKK